MLWKKILSFIVIFNITINEIFLLTDCGAKKSVSGSNPPSSASSQSKEDEQSSKSFEKDDKNAPPSNASSQSKEDEQSSKSFEKDDKSVPPSNTSGQSKEDEQSSKSFEKDDKSVPPSNTSGQSKEDEQSSKFFEKDDKNVPFSNASSQSKEDEQSSKSFEKDDKSVPPSNTSGQSKEDEQSSKSFEQFGKNVHFFNISEQSEEDKQSSTSFEQSKNNIKLDNNEWDEFNNFQICDTDKNDDNDNDFNISLEEQQMRNALHSNFSQLSDYLKEYFNNDYNDNIMLTVCKSVKISDDTPKKGEIEVLTKIKVEQIKINDDDDSLKANCVNPYPKFFEISDTQFKKSLDNVCTADAAAEIRKKKAIIILGDFLSEAEFEKVISTDYLEVYKN